MQHKRRLKSALSLHTDRHVVPVLQLRIDALSQPLAHGPAWVSTERRSRMASRVIGEVRCKIHQQQEGHRKKRRGTA
eukprot:3040716-Rhodomonas_salina.1